MSDFDPFEEELKEQFSSLRQRDRKGPAASTVLNRLHRRTERRQKIGGGLFCLSIGMVLSWTVLQIQQNPNPMPSNSNHSMTMSAPFLEPHFQSGSKTLPVSAGGDTSSHGQFIRQMGPQLDPRIQLLRSKRQWVVGHGNLLYIRPSQLDSSFSPSLHGSKLHSGQNEF